MLRFNRLKLTGFKSFVEPTDLVIEPGLTGIVGPNGCGKSNLVEALRWVMGESSAKQMRGGEMDDVIFNGTANRPARNIGEVILELDNAERTAPAQFNDFTELEVSRRIERGSGSTYRVNGSESRARDVQLLFADSTTGSRSTALVSQGRIGAIIAAKPVDRRIILEEAAGITGLHSRRHEAELRLRGAETNLTRLDDVVVTLESQLQSLKKQVRQASRYRNISGHVRRTEATLFLLRWRRTHAQLEEARGLLATAEAQVGELTGRAAATTTAQAAAAEILPALRQAEAERAAALHRLTVERDGLEAENSRVAEARREGQERLTHVATDSERERALSQDADTAVTRLTEEQEAIEQARRGEEETATEAAERLNITRQQVETLESALGELVRRTADDEARQAGLARRIEELENRQRRLTERAAEIEAQRTVLGGSAVDPAVLEEAETTLATVRDQLEQTRGAIETAAAERIKSAATAAESVTALHQVESALARVHAEEEALRKVLQAGDTDLWPPLIDALRVEPGLEAALGAALGEDLTAPTDEAAPVHWRTLEPFAEAAALPPGTMPLDRFVDGPPALKRRLSQIGLVADQTEGMRLCHALTQGQRLVSRDGALWRWDGFTMTADAVTAATTRLEQRNRLNIIFGDIDTAAAEVAAAQATADSRRAAAEAAANVEAAAQTALRQADAAYAQARDTVGDLKERAARHTSRLASIDEAAAAIAADIAENTLEMTAAAKAREEAPNPDMSAEEMAKQRAEVAEHRTKLVEEQSALATLKRDAESRQRRLDEIGKETASWRERDTGARRRIAELTIRRQEIEAELERLATLPEAIAEKRGVLLNTIEAAEKSRQTDADALSLAESTLAEADRAMRAAESELAQSREARVRAEGAVEQTTQAATDIVERVAERLQCAPDDLAEIAGVTADSETPDEETVERRLERLLRERDTMGPVNLRAEQEATELSEQMENLTGERDDLIKAIEKLRHGISQLNREGRARLLASFKEVDEHFQDLFVRLFGGGKAHLQLTESDDPLDAGLEIMASPPGKRMQVLSLLSGGEQALTALSLLFAVFMTNPAPICVLDEVDAPLDDANVGRFCSLVHDLASNGTTRFLIVTHHRVTMAHMDRLFGVTMSERGVSQLVSVDLQQAERMKATA